jgi:glycosyltransferase involved in cell wall biosynthesis
VSGRSIRRIAVFTPLPPTRSGIATYNSGFLPLLAEHVGVTAFVDDRLFGATSAPSGVQVRPASSHDPVQFDLTVFHMGNHLGNHEYIYDALCRTPGLIVLHDLRMAEFLAQLGHDRPDALDVSLPRSSAPIPTGEIDYAALEPLVQRARGVLIHSDTHAERLRRCFPDVPIIASRLALPTPPPEATRTTVEILGWPEGCLVVGAFGNIVEHRRLDRLLAAVAGVRDAGHDVRVIVGGWVASNSAFDALKSNITELGLTDAVRLFTDVSDIQLHTLHRMCDATFDLRASLTGASSLSVARSLAHGLVTVTTTQPEFTDIAHPLLRHVSNDPMEMTAECARIMIAMAITKAEGSMNVAGVLSGREFLLPTQSASIVSDHLRAIELCRQRDETDNHLLTRPSARSMVAGVPPVTVVADITATTGLMEYGRSLIDTLHGASVPFQLHDRKQAGASHDPRRDIMGLTRSIPSGRNADTEIWFANINEFTLIDDTELRPPGTDRRIIASWFWELPVVLEPMLSQFDRVDEVWVGSPFVARTFRQYCEVPITVVPMPIRAVPNERLERRDFGLPEGDVLFYFDFDANSHPARKNPLGLIRAFREAFTAADRDRSGRRPRLILKGLHMKKDVHRRTTDLLKAALEEVGGVIIDDELDRRELDALVNCCDVYVSLHRAEGLGIGMLEAMYLGKPVISPSYPDKWLFPASEVGFAVPARMRPIDSSDTAQYPEAAGVYVEGLPWVEPDISVAARHMQNLFHEPELRERMGARGARLVRDHYNARAALDVMSARLRSPSAVTTRA